MILDKRVGHKNVGADLASPFYLHLNSFDILDLVVMLSFLISTSLDFSIHSDLTVLMLAPLILAGRRSGRDMCYADGRFRLIDVLSSGSARAVRVYFQVLVTYVDLDIVRYFGSYLNCRKGSVPPSGSVKRRYAHKAVHPGFALQESERVFPLYQDHRALMPASSPSR